MFAQDHFNAALCHVKDDNFEGAKKHLNKLSQRGVNSGELTVLANLADPYDWGNYMLVYDQILEYSDKVNEYTAFELELKAIGDEIRAFQKQFLQYAFRVERLDDGTVKYIQKGKVIGVSKTDSCG